MGTAPSPYAVSSPHRAPPVLSLFLLRRGFSLTRRFSSLREISQTARLSPCPTERRRTSPPSAPRCRSTSPYRTTASSFRWGGILFFSVCVCFCRVCVVLVSYSTWYLVCMLCALARMRQAPYGDSQCGWSSYRGTCDEVIGGVHS